jgi:hypothetical protein
VTRFAGKHILGKVPETAKNGSFRETQPKAETSSKPASITDLEIVPKHWSCSANCSQQNAVQTLLCSMVSSWLFVTMEMQN